MRLLAYPAVGALLAGGYIGLGVYRLGGRWYGRNAARAVRTAQWWCRRMWPLLRVRVRVQGQLPAAPCICVANHRSYLDIFVVSGAVGGAFLSRSDLRDWPMIGSAASEMGSVFVARDDVNDRVRAARAVLRAVRTVRVFVFPEGTTTGGPLPGSFESGVFRLLHRSDVAIVPLTIRYSDRRAYWVEDLTVWQHFQRRVYDGPSLRVVLHVGEPIAPRRFGDAAALQAAVYAAVCQPLHGAGELLFIVTSNPIHPTLRLATYVAAVAVTPVLHGWCFAPQRTAWLAWFAFVPWFAALRLASTPLAIAITCWTTLLGAYLVANWLPDAVATYYLQGQLIGVSLFIGVWAASVGPFVVLFTVLHRWTARRVSFWLPMIGGAAWTGCELLRVRTLIGDPFGLFGYSQVEILPLMQLTAVTGIYGLSFLLAAANVALAELWIAVATAQRRAAYAAVINALLIVAVVLALLVWGDRRLADAPAASRSVPVSVVQGNLDLGSQWRQEFYGQNLEAYLRLSLQTLRAAPPRLVIWPESAMTFFLEEEPMYRASLASLFGPGKIELLAGGPRAVGPKPQQQYYNSAFLIAPDGSIVTHYDKQQLLPFAEYFPFGGDGLLRRQFARVREFAPGGEAQLLPTIAGKAGVVICNEVMFGEIAGQRVAAGAEYLVNLANDSWLGQEKYAEQAFDMARVRAIEQQRFLVRASTSGPSAIIDPFGRIVARAPYDSATTLAGVVAPQQQRTVYSRFGDLFGVACLAIAVAAAGWGRFRR